jgi:hypothetical protein
MGNAGFLRRALYECNAPVAIPNIRLNIVTGAVVFCFA